MSPNNGTQLSVFVHLPLVFLAFWKDSKTTAKIIWCNDVQVGRFGRGLAEFAHWCIVCLGQRLCTAKTLMTCLSLSHHLFLSAIVWLRFESYSPRGKMIDTFMVLYGWRKKSTKHDMEMFTMNWFASSKSATRCKWWIYYHNPNDEDESQTANTKLQPHFQPLQNLSSVPAADETVHIFNCTKIPLKFALNKLSETNGISNPSQSWHCNSFFSLQEQLEKYSREKAEQKNFHFKRFLSYFHFEKCWACWPRCADASINLNNQ